MAADWQQVKALFDESMALAPDARRAFVLGITADEAVRAEVLSLLAHASDDAGGSLGTAGPIVIDVAAEATSLHGERLGPWRVTGRLGSGGMGEVWRARRADGAFEGEAAIKVLKRGMDSEALLARFAHEQRALARMNHPHIARLFDAGLTPDGRPYFVMELVDGLPIDRAVQGRSVEERLALFLQLADAVAHAHQQLLVHRDLKPSNVLVDAQGQVKLLDFGIAKAIEGGDLAGDTTLHGQRPFTPLYASPEQVRGEPVGTGTDIYSLGVLLYQMLTGLRPYGRDATTPQAAVRSVLEDAPTRPSSLSPGLVADPHWMATRRRLVGDLDNILLKALEKPLERRYPTVQALVADIRACLEGFPVSARPASAGYLLSKFVQRNRWAVLAGVLGGVGLATGLAAALLQGRAATALGVVALAGGLGVALVQGRQAMVARDLAQRRFDDLRGLAHAVLFDYHELVEPLAGSTPLRKRMVQDALIYLARLAAAAPRDRALRCEIGKAYHTVGFVQRNGFRRPHLGDTAGAMDSYGRSIATLRQLVEEDSTDEVSAYELAIALSARAGVLGQDRQLAEAREGLREAAALFARHMAHDTTDLRHRLELARTHLRRADIELRNGLRAEALAPLDEARRTLDSLAALQPAHKELPHVWVWVHNIESYIAREDGDWPALLAAEGKVRALMLGLLEREPDNARFHEDLAGNAQWLMQTYGRLRDAPQVTLWGDEACSRWRRLVRADPDNRHARRRYFQTLALWGWACVEAGVPHEGRHVLDERSDEIEAWQSRWRGEFEMRLLYAALLIVHALASVAVEGVAADGRQRAQQAVDALQRDFAEGAAADEARAAMPRLHAGLVLTAADDVGSDAWITRSREVLVSLGVR
jgi:tetratricopeptide (TPR) repeat protein